MQLSEEYGTQQIPSSFRLALPSSPLPWPDALDTGSCISTGGNACELGHFSRNIAKPAHVGDPETNFQFFYRDLRNRCDRRADELIIGASLQRAWLEMPRSSCLAG